jgi:hypothetical protein
VKKVSLISFIVLISLLSACGFSNKTIPINLPVLTPISTASPTSNRQLTDFNFLEYGISYEEIVKIVGKEDRDIGSGLYLLEYSLADGSNVILQFFTLESLNSAYILYNDGKTEAFVLKQK